MKLVIIDHTEKQPCPESDGAFEYFTIQHAFVFQLCFDVDQRATVMGKVLVVIDIGPVG